jgi:hypothetical protein
MTAAERPRPEGYPATPELDKQGEIIRSGRAAAVQDFLDWLLDEKRVVLARYLDHPEPGVFSEQPVPIPNSPERLMAEHFGVDLNAVERERRAVLEWVRAQSELQP